jgi:hypothetical protein
MCYLANFTALLQESLTLREDLELKSAEDNVYRNYVRKINNTKKEKIT